MIPSLSRWAEAPDRKPVVADTARNRDSRSAHRLI
jgi:hypothetical protein